MPSGLQCSTYGTQCTEGGFTYENAGHLTANQGRTSTYGAENRQLTLTESSTWTYVYDGEGRRVQKSDGTQTVTYVYDAMGNLVLESGSLTTTGPQCNTCYLTADHLGSTRLVTDQTEVVTRGYDYLPFGHKIDTSYGSRSLVTGYQSPTDFLPTKFTGKERDSETGLDYFGARYMSSAQGRFTSPDPPLLDQHILDPQSWNLYAYGRNNPLLYVDPTGNEVELIGNEDQRKRELAVLQQSVGKKAEGHLSVETVNGHYMVRIKGDQSDFAKLGTGAADLSSLVGAKPVVEFGITDKALPECWKRPSGVHLCAG